MSFTSYLLSLTALVVITAVSQMILPDGRLKKTSKTIFCLVLITCMIKPVIVSESFDFDFSYANLAIDENAVYRIDTLKTEEIKEYLVKILDKEGIPYKNVDIVLYDDLLNAKIKKVIVKLNKSRIKDESEHINITRKTICLLKETLSVDDEVIIVE